MSGDDMLLPTDAEMNSRRGFVDDDGLFRDGDAPVIPDTIARANWALKRLEKRAKERAKAGATPLPQNPGGE